MESSNYKIADATVKINTKTFTYEIQVLVTHWFEIGNIQSHGFSLLSGKLDETSVNLQIRNWGEPWKHLDTLKEDVSNQTVTSVIKKYLTTLHEL